MKWRDVKQDSDKWSAQDDGYILDRAARAAIERRIAEHRAYRERGGWTEISEPEIKRHVFISGLGLVGVAICPNCGGESEQYNKDYNHPVKYCCKSCYARMEKTGAMWEMNTTVRG